MEGEGEREKEGERVTGALAPFSYLVVNSRNVCVFNKVIWSNLI